jgi:hypothetical protein
MFWNDPPFDPEPITVILGLISTGVTALVNEFGSRLEEEEFSLPYALAYGYVNNFIEPLITELLRTVPVGGPAPRLYVYVPDSLRELEPKNIENAIARMRMMKFEDKVVNLQFREGRARDVLTVSRGPGQLVYFDFPNTLLSLNSLIDYKIESRKNQFNDSVRAGMGREYIRKFREVTEKLVESKSLKDYVFFVDKELNFQFSES